ncbi:MAG: GNAT family N-acetyltransferase [Nanoarchaeota archaeon]|nr:GNAT family N-acetyltransferase [Nanoarchaeota archaeon]
MEKIKIRKATLKDLKIIQELNHKLCKEENKQFDITVNPDFPVTKEGEEYFKIRIEKDDGCALIASDGEKIIGYLVGGILKPESYRILSEIAELGDMFVLEEYRNKSVGTKLHSSFIDWCGKKGIKRIRVVASAKNLKAINFYKKNKFKEYDLVLERDL